MIKINKAVLAGFLAGIMGSVVGSYLIATVQAASPNMVTAHEFRLVDQNERTIATLGPDAKVGANLQLMDPSGKRTLQINGTPWIGFFKPAAAGANLGLGYGDDNGPAVWFSNVGHGYMKIQVENAGPILRLTKEGATEKDFSGE